MPAFRSRKNGQNTGGAPYQHNGGKVLAYILKGADAETGAALGLARYGEGGLIIGKRCGRSQNIGTCRQATNTC